MNAPFDPVTPAAAPIGPEHALRVAKQALEAHWPRRFDADSRRDHDAIKAIDAALEAIETSGHAASPLQRLNFESKQLVIKLDKATEQISLRFVPSDQPGAQALADLNIVLSPAAAKGMGMELLAGAIALENHLQRSKAAGAASNGEGAEGGAA